MCPRLPRAAGWRGRGPLHLEGRVPDPGERGGRGRGRDPRRGGGLGQLGFAQSRLFAAAALLLLGLLSTFSTTVLEPNLGREGSCVYCIIPDHNPDLDSCFTHLNSGFWQIDFERDLLPHEDVRVSRLLEQGLEDVQLGPGEGCPLPPLLPVGRPGEVRVGGVAHGVVQARRVHGGHGQVEAVHPVPVLEVGHGGLGAAAGGEGREGQRVVRGQPNDNTKL